MEERWDDTVSEREQIDTNPSIDMTDSKTEKKLIPMYTWLLVASGGMLICFSVVASRPWNDGLSYGELICGSDTGSTFDESFE